MVEESIDPQTCCGFILRRQLNGEPGYDVGMIETYCTWYETLQQLKMSIKHARRPQLIRSKRTCLDRTRFCVLQLEEAREGDVHVNQKVLRHARE